MDDTTFHMILAVAGSLPPSYLGSLNRQFRKEAHQRASMSAAPLHARGLSDLRDKHLQNFEATLNASNGTSRCLVEPAVAEIVMREIERGDGEGYGLLACTIMPNHVHILAHPLGRGLRSFGQAVDALKRSTDRKCTLALSRIGCFWDCVSCIYALRCEDELERTLWYIACNPVMAGLAKTWQSWPWTYVGPGLI